MKSQTYTPDWANIPANYNWVAVYHDGEVFAFGSRPEIDSNEWCGGVPFRIIGVLTPAPPGDQWKEMLYQRPKPAAA